MSGGGARPTLNRAASLALLGQQWGPLRPSYGRRVGAELRAQHHGSTRGRHDDVHEPVGFAGKILRIQPHMHLLGTGMKVTLDPGTPRQRVLLNDTAYDFDYQRSFDMPKPIPVISSDKISVECTYDPQLEQELPQLRRLPLATSRGERARRTRCASPSSAISVSRT